MRVWRSPQSIFEPGGLLRPFLQRTYRGAVAVFADIVDIRSQIYTEQLVANGEPRIRRILAI